MTWIGTPSCSAALIRQKHRKRTVRERERKLNCTSTPSSLSAFLCDTVGTQGESMKTLVPDSGVEELWPNVHLSHQATVPQAQVYDEKFSSRIAKMLWYGSCSGSFDR